MPVVGDLDADHAVGLVAVQSDRDGVGIGVEAVPHELYDRLDRIILVGEPLDEVVAGLQGNTSHGAAYRLPLVRLCVWQSIVRLARLVDPPFDQAVT
ncbi:hypothetical protein GCM10022275_24500 [Tessaracoccus defluvii]